MHRLFVALRPPPAIRSLLAATMDGIAGARWQEDTQLHLTLRYIGAVERVVAEDVAVALDHVRAGPLTLAIGGVGSFDRHGGGAAVWAGVTPGDAITALHRKVDHALVRIGLAPERRAYLPHITLARLGRRSGRVDDWLAKHGTLSTAPFTISHILLYESHLDREGARYDAVARYALTG